jgi:circadian clock protein KaiB
MIQSHQILNGRRPKQCLLNLLASLHEEKTLNRKKKKRVRQQFPKRKGRVTPKIDAADPSQAPYVLKLFVTGTTPRSLRAITNLQVILQEHLAGRYELQIVDLYQQPELAKDNQLVAAPTLIKRLPEPSRRVIGDMSNTAEVLLGLDITPG